MTEAEWLGCNDPITMLEFLRPTVSDRKWRLYLCGGCWQLTRFFFRPESLTAVKVAERYADGEATQVELDRAEWDAESPTFGFEFEKEGFPYSHSFKAGIVPRLVEIGALPESTSPGSEWQVDDAVKDQLLTAAYVAEYSAVRSPKNDPRWWLKNISQVNWPGRWLFDCVFGNPFRPVTIDPAWLTANVAALAQGIYDERDFGRLPVLADALEEAGCHGADILAHCRQPGPHVRGCWVVDLLLGKE